jgi:transcriptional regulator with XRE-family HTH domain
MTLEDWRKKRGLSYAKLAELLGASHATMVRRWCRPFEADDKVIPTVKYMNRVLEITHGEVKPNDFYLRRN